MTVTTVPSSPVLHSARFGLTTAAVQAEGDRSVVVLRGEADFSSTSVVSDVLSWVLTRGAGDVIVDLAELTFMDTATGHVLAEGRALFERSGRHLSFRAPSRLAFRVLHMCALADLVEAEAAV